MVGKLRFKVVIIGDAAVGKTSLLRKFVEGKFQFTYLPTLGVDITTKSVVVDGKECNLLCVDTAGQEYFGRIRPGYYRGANGAIVVYDITNQKSFENIPFWIDELHKEVKEDIPLVLIGNKRDLEDMRTVPTEKGNEYATEHNMLFWELSAKVDNKETVEKVFHDLTFKMLHHS